jgi:ubiquinone/menaquinone biosynthesis C-methylase UbiE
MWDPMTNKKVQRLGVRVGYDYWSETYDQSPNPLVALDRRYTISLLQPQRGERILDAGCGTGRNLKALLQRETKPVGLDFSLGMLKVTRRRFASVPLAQANFEDDLPLKKESFEAALCALVGEHLTNLSRFFNEAFEALLPLGRFVFSVFHPDMAAVGIEANFERDGVEYRLGAYQHKVEDYLTAMEDAGFCDLNIHEFCGDDTLVSEIPSASKYVGYNLLLVIKGSKGTA